MRDPARIGPALEMIRKAWSANPDLRLGQLVYNAANAALDQPLPTCNGLFQIEDDRLLSGLSEISGTSDVGP